MPVLPEVASTTVWPRLELAGFFRRLDDAEREPVLDRAERVEGLALDVEVDALGRQAWLILTTGVRPTVSRMLANFAIGFLPVFFVITGAAERPCTRNP